jgi:hypothetical protein
VPVAELVDIYTVARAAGFSIQQGAEAVQTADPEGL